MAKNVRESLSLKKLAAIPPVLPIISDHPLDTLSASQDKFDLCYRLGPVFDIIRHKNTAMPTTIAIYGDWGTGKTSAMRWLEALINEWNKLKDGPDKTTVHPVWFYPWKYHDKEDVWRGLISEVIIKSIDVKEATPERVKEALKQFGLFLGKSFVHVLSSMTFKAGKEGVAGVEVELSAIKSILADYAKVAHPEKAYLNEFESSLEKWINNTLGKNERMVIFIDDLDRCMPEIALQVLEALKLYLKIDKLIFVVGLDKDVIEKLVKDHYRNLGLDDSKSEKYLAKMFQTEVVVGPSERQVTDYLDDQLEKIEYFKGKYLEADEKKLFKKLIEEFADRNPREVKRLINSAVMAGAGAEMLKNAGEKPSIAFKQGLQVFFIREIIEKLRNTDSKIPPRLIGSNHGNEFFAKWSEIVRKNEGDPLFKNHIPSIKTYLRQVEKEAKDKSLDLPKKWLMKSNLAEIPPDIPEAYLELTQIEQFENLLSLLADEDLGRLMQIEFSSEIAEISLGVVEFPPIERISDEEMVRVAIAEDLKKKPEEICPEDYNRVKKIDLNNSGITNFNFLQNMTNLNVLNLRANKITNFTFLKDLAKLTELDFAANQITDLVPLKDLKNLTNINFLFNQIDDITPLKNLTNLTRIDLHGNKITDISILKDLTNLMYLSLGGNQIIDISPLKDLINLIEVNLGGNQIVDLSSLKGLTKLTQLNLWKNPITDISPIQWLTKLMRLGIQSTPVMDLTVLIGLSNLEYLNIKDCPRITNKQVAELQKALPNLKIER